jgi:hypothetical protein
MFELWLSELRCSLDRSKVPFLTGSRADQFASRSIAVFLSASRTGALPHSTKTHVDQAVSWLAGFCRSSSLASGAPGLRRPATEHDLESC